MADIQVSGIFALVEGNAPGTTSVSGVYAIADQSLPCDIHVSGVDAIVDQARPCTTQVGGMCLIVDAEIRSDAPDPAVIEFSVPTPSVTNYVPPTLYSYTTVDPARIAFSVPVHAVFVDGNEGEGEGEEEDGCWPPCRCPGGVCLIGEDAFDDPSPGSGWEQVSGTWACVTVDGNGTVTTSDANAYLRYETGHPDAVAEHVVLANISTNASYWDHGDKARIVLCDTLAAEIEFGFLSFGGTITDSGCIILRIFNGASMVQESPPIRVESSGGLIGLWAGYSATTGVLWAAAATSDGRLPDMVRVAENVGTITGAKVGLGTGDTVDGTIAFTNFKYYRHNYAGGESDCFGPGPESTPGCEFAWPWYRDAGTAIGEVDCGWTIVSGTWNAVESDAGSAGADLLTTSSASATIECTAEQSAATTSEPTPLGYHRATTWITFIAAGDKARVYIDWNGTTGHYVEITCGGAYGAGSSVSLYKNGSLLGTKTPTIPVYPTRNYGPVVNSAIAVEVCLSPMSDGSGLDALVAKMPAFDISGYSMSLADATTVNGYTKVAFGTGSTVTGTVKFGKMRGYSNVGTCADCSYSECEWCPASDGPDNGLSIAITGLTTPHGAWCNCTNAEGTYAVPTGTIAGWRDDGDIGPSGCDGWMRWVVCDSVTFGIADIRLNIAWHIEEKLGGGWNLYAEIWLDGSDSFVYGGATYKAELTMASRCDTLSGLSLTYDSIILSSSGLNPTICGNWQNLTITASNY